MHVLQFTLLLATCTSYALAFPLSLPFASFLAPRAKNISQPIHYLFTFGDSYSYTAFNVNGSKPSCSGNLIGNPAFPGSTTSGGINWVGEVVTRAPVCTLSYDFAWYGATVNYSVVSTLSSAIPSFINQVSDFGYTAALQPDWAPWNAHTAAFAVWFGVNDVANSFEGDHPAAVDRTDMGDYFEQLDNLYSAGGRIFLLFNTPPVNRTPAFLMTSKTTQVALHAAVTRWNNRLTNLTAAWQATHPGSTVRILDAHGLFLDILNQPKAYGAQNATCYDSDGTTCLWWNNYHPGIAIQTALGKQASSMLQKMGFWASRPDN